MSDLIIKGMDMPKNCLLCPCCVGEGIGMGRRHYCQAIDDEPYVSENHRPENCPIPKTPTPHGRLIDADRLLEAFREALEEDSYWVNFFAIVENAPTVIEAEQGDG